MSPNSATHNKNRAVYDWIAYAGALALSAAAVWSYHLRRAPYFEVPATVMDHVGIRPHATRDVLLLIPQVEPLLRRGAEVTCFRPNGGAVAADDPDFLTAVGLLPHQSVVPSATITSIKEQSPEYVIAIGEPLHHPFYVPIAGFEQGFLYERR